MANRNYSGKRKKRMMAQMMRSFGIALVIMAVLGLIIAGAWYFLTKESAPKNVQEQPVSEEEAEEETTTESATVDGLFVADYQRDELVRKLCEMHPWAMVLTYEGASFDITNYLEASIEKTVDQAYADANAGAYQVQMTPEEIEMAADSIVSSANSHFEEPAAEAGGMTYNEETDNFEVQEAPARQVVNETALKEALIQAMSSQQFRTSMEIPMIEEPATGSADRYETIGYFSTKTTSNKDRNTNVNLACESVNGTILKPGETFSYNECLGPRTPEKGYKEAGAYANGEHVLEYGGGICQVSTTIYNAAIAANIQIDERRGHTYEPSYVTPGNDAAVSYPNPNFIFTNDTGEDLGIRAHFHDQTIEVEFFGVRTLDEGVKRYLRSERVGDAPPPEPIYIEDLTVVPGAEIMTSTGKVGSVWDTYIVLEKDGEVISEEYLHKTKYKGNAPEVHRNLSGVYVDPATLLNPQPAQ